MSLETEITSCSFVKKTLSFTGSSTVYLLDPGIKQIMK